MFRKLMILSVIFSLWACQTKSEKSGVKKKKGSDTKFNMFGDLPDGVFVKTIMAAPVSCKKVIETCSSSKGMIKRCLESNLWDEALRKFFQVRDMQVDDTPRVCLAEQGLAIDAEQGQAIDQDNNISQCKKILWSVQ